MNLEQFRSYCLSLPGSYEDFPFGEDVMVFKVKEKIFALCGIEPFDSINLKCDPELAAQLRERHSSVLPGYHMNKKHWNTILMDHSVPDRLILEWTEHSYHLVAPKRRNK